MNLRELQKDWDAWGRLDPLWAILSLPGKEKAGWQLEEFFATGDDEINNILDYVRSLGITPRTGRALDFGCGVGRLSQALCAHFDNVCGIDIAPSMVALAKKYNRFDDRCRYVLNQADDLSIFEEASFDFIYSCRVLQHMEPQYCRSYLKEFLRLLTPAGVLVFQEPAKQLPAAAPKFVPPESSAFKKLLRSLLPDALQRLYWTLKLSYLKRLAANQPQMEMHCIEKEEMTKFLTEAGAQIIDIVSDDSAPGFLSFRYCLTKQDR
jgi:ubiquinone/menaquinone biosynthesis C-methylase UbiE